MSLAFLFPCQGSQQPGMLSRLPNGDIKEYHLQAACRTLGRPITELESEEALTGTEATQIALYLAGVVGSKTLIRTGVKPSYCAGHSIGGFAAAVACGVLEFETGLEVVRHRAALMQSAFPNGYGMGVIVGICEPSVNLMLLELASAGRQVFLSIVNSRAQVVITGKLCDVDAALGLARANGARKAIRLNVAAPSHCVLLRDVANKLRGTFSGLKLRDPQIPYVANRTGRILRDGHEIWEDLMAAIEHPVRWYEMSTILVEAGVSIFIQMPPGRCLSDLIQKAFPSVRSFAADDHEISWLSEMYRYLSTKEPSAVFAGFEAGVW